MPEVCGIAATSRGRFSSPAGEAKLETLKAYPNPKTQKVIHFNLVFQYGGQMGFLFLHIFLPPVCLNSTIFMDVDVVVTQDISIHSEWIGILVYNHCFHHLFSQRTSDQANAFLARSTSIFCKVRTDRSRHLAHNYTSCWQDTGARSANSIEKARNGWTATLHWDTFIEVR